MLTIPFESTKLAEQLRLETRYMNNDFQGLTSSVTVFHWSKFMSPRICSG